MFVLTVALLTLLAMSFPYLEPGSESYVMLKLNLLILVPMLVALAVIIRLDWRPLE
jgi:hypothetical protein